MVVRGGRVIGVAHGDGHGGVVADDGTVSRVKLHCVDPVVIGAGRIGPPVIAERVFGQDAMRGGGIDGKDGIASVGVAAPQGEIDRGVGRRRYKAVFRFQLPESAEWKEEAAAVSGTSRQHGNQGAQGRRYCGKASHHGHLFVADGKSNHIHNVSNAV